MMSALLALVDVEPAAIHSWSMPSFSFRVAGAAVVAELLWFDMVLMDDFQ